jgi:hypothetical protein
MMHAGSDGQINQEIAGPISADRLPLGGTGNSTDYGEGSPDTTHCIAHGRKRWQFFFYGQTATSDNEVHENLE